MTWFAVYEATSRKLVSVGTVVADDSILVAQGRLKKEFAFDPSGMIWNEAIQDFDPAPPPKRVTDIRDFLNLFTPVEREDIFELVTINKQARGFIEYAKAAGSVDLNDAFVITAVNRLETAGVIASGRAVEVLA